MVSRFSKRSLHERPDGTLVIIGHDMGPEVERFWGCREYEFERTVDPAGVRRLRSVAELGEGPLVAALRARFAGTGEIERFLAEHGIDSRFWSRVGD